MSLDSATINPAPRVKVTSAGSVGMECWSGQGGEHLVVDELELVRERRDTIGPSSTPGLNGERIGKREEDVLQFRRLDRAQLLDPILGGARDDELVDDISRGQIQCALGVARSERIDHRLQF